MQSFLDHIPLPDAEVSRIPMTLFRRHLGLPACAELDARLNSLADAARSWYTQHGEPWRGARRIGIQRIVYDVIHLENQHRLSSALLACIEGFQ